MGLIKSIKQIEWHRNGVAGTGFYAILFDNKEHGLMLAILFDEPGYCAVVRVEDLSQDERGVTFGINSWRGDRYEDELREAVKNQRETNRLGPFSLPV